MMVWRALLQSWIFARDEFAFKRIHLSQFKL